MNVLDPHEPGASTPERRATPRYSFGVVQRIAEMVDGELPSLDAFTRVQVVDLSRGGFSVYAQTEPKSDMLVIALGDLPEITYLTARVVYSKRIERWGHQFFRLGCEFAGRARQEDCTLIAQQQDEGESAFLLLSNEAARDDWARVTDERSAIA